MSEDNIIEVKGGPQVGLLGSSILLCATTLGAGILAIPSTVALVGIVVGVVTLFFFGLCSIYSIYMLIKVGDILKVKSYEEVVDGAFPKIGRIMTTIFMDILLFGALTGFMVIIADQVHNVVSYASGGVEAWYTEKVFLLVIITVFVIFPLAMLKNISLLEYSSFAAVIIIFCFTIITIVIVSKRLYYNIIDWSTVKLYDFSVTGIFKATPIISLAYTCQGSIFPIWKELSRPTLSRMNMVQVGANIFCGTLYCIVGFFGYLLAPVNTPGNILNGLPNQIFYVITRSAFSIAIIFHYPVVHFGFRTSLEVTIFNNSKFNWIRHTIETGLVVAASTVFAILLPDLTKVFDLTGAIAAYPIAFMFPAICYIKIMYYDNAIARKHNYSAIQDDDEMDFSKRGDNYQKSFKNLLDGRVIPPLLLSLMSLVASIVSLYITITTEFIPK